MPYLSRLSTRLALRFAGAVALLASAACSDGPAAPVAPPPASPSASSDGLPSGVTPSVSAAFAAQPGERAKGVKRGAKLPHDFTASVDVDWRGGQLAIPQAGLTLIIPPFAVSQRTHITVTARAGNAMAYEFEPHGLRFRVPLLMSQDLRGSSWDGSLLSLPTLGYYADAATLDVENGLADIVEWLPSGVSLGSHTFVGLIPHFSGYMVSSGRR